jgi:hypothetical protein
MSVPYPTDILWYFNAQSLNLNDGDLVTTWPDLSGANRHATALAGHEPSYKAVGINGTPCVVFDNFDFLNTGQDATTRVSTNTVFMVMRHFNPVGNWDCFLGVPDAIGTHVSPWWRWGFFSDPTSPNARPNRRHGLTSVTGTAQQASWWNQLSVWKMRDGELFKDNISIIPADLTDITYNTNDALFIGANGLGGVEDTTAEYADMEVWGILVYNRSLTNSEVLAVEQYIEDSWLNTSLTLYSEKNSALTNFELDANFDYLNKSLIGQEFLAIASSGTIEIPLTTANVSLNITGVSTIQTPTVLLDARIMTLTVKSSATHALTWHANYRPIGVSLLSSTVDDFEVVCIYNLADNKWDVISVRIL